MTDKRIQSYLEDRLKRLESIRNEREWTTAELGDIACCKQILAFINSLQEETVSEDFKKFEEQYLEKEKDEIISVYDRHAGLVDGAQWQKEHLWKPADGDDLPEVDREVIVLIEYNAQRNIHDDEYPTYRVGFGHRPNPDGWDGKNIDTNEVTHYTPKLYDKGGWNAPNIVYWLDYDINELLCREK